MSENDDDRLIRLRHHAVRLGIDEVDKLSAEELAEALDDRLQLVEQIGRQPLADILLWADERVDDDESVHELAARVLRLRSSHYDGLSRNCLEALAHLHGVHIKDDDDAQRLRDRLEHRGGLGGRIRRARRKALSYLIGKIVGETEQDVAEEPRPRATDQVKRKGLVQGLSSYVRGSVDDYVAEKLDEIEKRIDRKLEDIDRQMDQWRRREVMHRLRIIRITLMATLVVAILSLLYEIVRRLMAG